MTNDENVRTMAEGSHVATPMEHSIDSVEDCETCIELLREYATRKPDVTSGKTPAVPMQPLTDDRRRLAAVVALDAIIATHEGRCDDVDVHLRFAEILCLLWEPDQVQSLMDDVQESRVEWNEPLLVRGRLPERLQRAAIWSRLQFTPYGGAKDYPLTRQ